MEENDKERLQKIEDVKRNAYQEINDKNSKNNTSYYISNIKVKGDIVAVQVSSENKEETDYVKFFDIDGNIIGEKDPEKVEALKLIDPKQAEELEENQDILLSEKYEDDENMLEELKDIDAEMIQDKEDVEKIAEIYGIEPEEVEEVVEIELEKNKEEKEKQLGGNIIDSEDFKEELTIEGNENVGGSRKTQDVSNMKAIVLGRNNGEMKAVEKIEVNGKTQYVDRKLKIQNTIKPTEEINEDGTTKKSKEGFRIIVNDTTRESIDFTVEEGNYEAKLTRIEDGEVKSIPLNTRSIKNNQEEKEIYYKNTNNEITIKDEAKREENNKSVNGQSWSMTEIEAMAQEIINNSEIIGRYYNKKDVVKALADGINNEDEDISVKDISKKVENELEKSCEEEHEPQGMNKRN